MSVAITSPHQRPLFENPGIRSSVQAQAEQVESTDSIEAGGTPRSAIWHSVGVVSAILAGFALSATAVSTLLFDGQLAVLATFVALSIMLLIGAPLIIASVGDVMENESR